MLEELQMPDFHYELGQKKPVLYEMQICAICLMQKLWYEHHLHHHKKRENKLKIWKAIDSASLVLIVTQGNMCILHVL